MPLSIVHGDITKMATDAIVNAANTALRIGGGVCGAIFAAAGEAELSAACERIGFCAVGEAVVTGGFRLPARQIIHTVGPVWRGGVNGEESMLRASYRNSLSLADSLKLESIAFPLISSGIFGYPKEQALSVAVTEIESFLQKHDLQVSLVLYP